MLALLFSVSVIITAENASAVFDNPNKKPVLLKLWATWCPHCKEFQPTWDELESDPELQQKIIMAELECEENRMLCKDFEGEAFPRIYWMDLVQNQTVRYFGDRTLAGFRRYINKQLHFPLITVDGDDDLRGYLSDADSVTSFVFDVKSNDEAAVSKAKEIATKFRNFESRMILRISDKNQLTAHVGSGRSVEYPGAWDVDAVKGFVIRNSVPFLARLGPSVLKHLDNENWPFFAIVTKENESVSESNYKIAVDAAALLPVVSANCQDHAWICRYCSIDTNKTGYVVFDRHKRLFWRYNGKWTEEDVGQWLRNVVAGKVWSRGPGTGLFSSFLEEYYDSLADGQQGAWQFLAAPIILSGGFVLAIANFFIDRKLKARKKALKQQKKAE